MCEIDSKIMWPNDDIYFYHGVKYIHERLRQLSVKNDYYFVNICGFNLKKFMLTPPELKGKRVVLISSPRLLPFANFMLNLHPEVCAVFKSSLTVEEVITRLSLEIDVSHQTTRLFEYKDYELLLYYLNSENINELQKKYSRSYSSIQRWKCNLAKNFMLRRLMDVTLRY